MIGDGFARRIDENKVLKALLPGCGEPKCGLARRAWRRLRCWDAGIRLFDACFCDPRCLEKALCRRFEEACRREISLPRIEHRIPLGLILLSRGQLSNAQLRLALESQSQGCHQPIGQCLEKLGFAAEHQITAALAQQWACPVLTTKLVPDRRALQWVPFRILESSRMVPLRFVESTRILHMAFADGIDYVALYALREMLNCEAEACLVSRSAMDAALESLSSENVSGDFLFESWRTAADMARVTCSYALKLDAEQVKIVSCGRTIWARLTGQDNTSHLLFRHPASFQMPIPELEEPVHSFRHAG